MLNMDPAFFAGQHFKRYAFFNFEQNLKFCTRTGAYIIDLAVGDNGFDFAYQRLMHLAFVALEIPKKIP